MAIEGKPDGVRFEHSISLARVNATYSCDHCNRQWKKGDHIFSLSLKDNGALNAYMRIEFCERCASGLATRILQIINDKKSTEVTT